MSNRVASVERKTGETSVYVNLALDGTGKATLEVPIGFLAHLLNLLALHSRMDIEVRAKGDLEVDDHHLTEDIGISLGQALNDALGERRGVVRYGSILMPMDEVLVAVALDLGGRFAFSCDYRPQREKIGDLSTEMISHFFSSLAVSARMNLHFKLLSPGENEHHRVEAMFKGLARSLRMAVALDEKAQEEVPSTKGVL